MDGCQISMGFESPAIESHTLPEFVGAWNSHITVDGEIKTTDGRHLAVSIRMAETTPQEHEALEITINGHTEVLETPRMTHPWMFRGESLASIASDHACGLYPRVWAEQEEEYRRRRLESSQRNKREMRDIKRQINREAKERLEAKNQ